jgi:hypothetical protein
MTRPITPPSQDFDAVKMDYCRKRHIDDAQLSARFEADNQLAAKLSAGASIYCRFTQALTA